ncbi:MAG: hypothetical protein JSS68_12665 [Actinobacteria bacterium]|nr:hypothetical protein [Actinomycetota bacterium]
MQLATAAWVDGFAALERTVDELGAHLRQQGVGSVAELVGRAADAALGYDDVPPLTSG